MWEASPLHKLEEAIDSPSNPIGMRMRAAYFLRQAYETAVRNPKEAQEEQPETTGVVDEEKSEGQQQASTVEEIVIATLERGLMDERHGSLLRHEFAYVMGQLRDERVRFRKTYYLLSCRVFIECFVPYVLYYSPPFSTFHDNYPHDHTSILRNKSAVNHLKKPYPTPPIA